MKLSVEQVGDSVRAFQRAYDGSMERIATILPQVAQDLGRMSGALAVVSGAGLEGRLEAIGSIAQTLHKGMEGQQGREEELQRCAAQVRVATASIRDNAQKIELLSRRMHILALNACVVAAASGDEGRAFGVLTDEIVRLKSVASASANGVMTLSDRVSRGVEALLARFDELAVERGERVTSVEGEVQQALAQGRHLLGELRETLTQGSEKLQESAGGVGAIMEAIQRQDIHRQELDHISAVLKEAAGDRSPERRVLFQHRCAELAFELMEKTGTEIDQLFSELTCEFRRVQEVAQGLSHLPIELRGAHSVEGNLLAPLGRLELVREALQKDHEALQAVTDRTTGMIDETAQLSEHLVAINKLCHTLRIVHVMTRIELAREARLAHATPLAEGIGEIRGAFLELCEQIDRDSRELKNSLGALQSTLTVSLRESSVVRGDVSERLGAERSMIGQAATEFAASVENLAQLGLTLGRTAQTCNSSTQALGVEQKVKQLKASLAELASEAKRDLPRGLSLDSEDERILSRLVERFTTLAHKEIGSQGLGGLELEAGDQAGELTLF